MTGRRRDFTSLGWRGAGWAMAGAILGAAFVWQVAWWMLAAWTVVGAVGGAAAWMDATTGRIPNAFTLLGGGTVVAAVVAGAVDRRLGVLGDAAAGLVVGAALFALLFIVGQMGGGDVKLAAVFGAAAGLVALRCALVVTFGMLAAASLAGLYKVVLAGPKAKVRLGPALVVGAFLGLLAWRNDWLQS